uniref:Uncharacterized protein n=1 Tax=Oryza sativa subsp. japonica TaxID=39947 RepID=Q6K8T0_ORYSJ|nr:hypothetical protein [Oryza sativa Japonica Group]BAD21649.1 hypothetical protein [Oryza sativa Japonica Group]
MTNGRRRRFHCRGICVHQRCPAGCPPPKPVSGLRTSWDDGGEEKAVYVYNSGAC